MKTILLLLWCMGSGVAALASTADALHSAMLQLQIELSGTDSFESEVSAVSESKRLSSVFCPAESLDYTDLLSSAQFAFKRGDYEASRACYSRALRRYWQEYDASIRPGLIEATSGNLARMQADTLRMRDALEHLTEQMPSAGSLGSGAASNEENVHYRHYEREHRLPGQHAAPPGSVPLGSSVRVPAVQPAAAASEKMPAASAGQSPAAESAVKSSTAGGASSPRLADASIGADNASVDDNESSVSSPAADATTQMRREQLHMLAQQALQLARKHRQSQRGRQHRSGGKQRQLEPA